MIELPVSFPSDAIQVIYTAWKNKDFQTPGLAKAIWNLAGYLASTAAPVLVRRADGPPPNDEQIDQAFQNLLKGAIDTDALRIAQNVSEELKEAA